MKPSKSMISLTVWGMYGLGCDIDHLCGVSRFVGSLLEQIFHLVDDCAPLKRVVRLILRIGLEMRPHPVRHLSKLPIPLLANLTAHRLQPVVQHTEGAVYIVIRKVGILPDKS